MWTTNGWTTKRRDRLAEELPWWGWLEDGRTCLTRAGELLSIGRLTPSVLDGQTSEQLDRVIDRWQRMLSGLDPRTRLYFYLLRRPVRFARTIGAGEALGRGRARTAEAPQAFLEQNECRDVSAYVAWCARSSTYAAVAPGEQTGGPWWSGHCQELDGAPAQPAIESVYL